mmetsp:Transcript_13576/g.31846  ORF Transcript_13576/g.31846 Transcript_13576/m.31846 type:complete len:86 (-) Transcript_13576:849-1106(-)
MTMNLHQGQEQKQIEIRGINELLFEEISSHEIIQMFGAHICGNGVGPLRLVSIDHLIEHCELIINFRCFLISNDQMYRKRKQDVS